MNKLKITDKGLRVLYTLQDPILLGGAAGGYAGYKSYLVSRKQWVGWVVGVLTFIVVLILVAWIIQSVIDLFSFEVNLW